MTAEEFIDYCDSVKPESEFKNWLLHTKQYEKTKLLMKLFAKLKCKELLEIVAEKAKVIGEIEQHSAFNYVTPDDIVIVDKESILNAVDLDEFIK